MWWAVLAATGLAAVPVLLTLAFAFCLEYGGRIPPRGDQ